MDKLISNTIKEEEARSIKTSYVTRPLEHDFRRTYRKSIARQIRNMSSIDERVFRNEARYIKK